MHQARLAFGLARRELRGGVAGFRIFLACLVLGVAAIAVIGTMSASIEAGLRADARKLLGGDVEVRMTHRPIDAAQRAHLEARGRLSEVVTMRGMARAPNARRTLVEVKAVDGVYPLFGALALADGESQADRLEQRDGVWGVLIDPSLMGRLGTGLGERLRLGGAPDRPV